MRTKGFAVAVGVVLTFASGQARAGQLVVMDETYVHAPDLPDSHYRVVPGAEAPADWTTPIDWTQGSVWVHLEVLSKPTAQETKFQICFEATPTYACTLQSPIYTEVGVYEWESTFAQFWSPPGEFVDWTQGVHKIACILKDTMNGKPSEDNVGPETAALYMPTELRVVITLVEPGSVYEPPAPVGEETTGGETTDASTGDGSTSTSGDSSTSDGTGAPATTTGSSSTTSEAVTTSGSSGPAPTTGAGGASSGSTGTTGGEGGSGTGGAQDTSESGCGCRGGGDAPGGLALLLAGLAWRRRSRR